MTLDQIQNMLRINKHRLDDELEMQSQIHYQIAEKVATLNAQQAGLKEALAEVEAQIQLDLRKSETKISVAEANAEVALDPEYQSASRKYQASRKEHEQWLGMLGAWQARGYSLKTLSDLYVASYFAVDSAGRDKDYSASRRAMSEARETTTRPEVKPRRTRITEA